MVRIISRDPYGQDPVRLDPIQNIVEVGWGGSAVIIAFTFSFNDIDGIADTADMTLTLPDGEVITPIDSPGLIPDLGNGVADDLTTEAGQAAILALRESSGKAYFRSGDMYEAETVSTPGVLTNGGAGWTSYTKRLTVFVDLRGYSPAADGYHFTVGCAGLSAGNLYYNPLYIVWDKTDPCCSAYNPNSTSESYVKSVCGTNYFHQLTFQSWRDSVCPDGMGGTTCDSVTGNVYTTMAAADAAGTAALGPGGYSVTLFPIGILNPTATSFVNGRGYDRDDESHGAWLFPFSQFGGDNLQSPDNWEDPIGYETAALPWPAASGFVWGIAGSGGDSCTAGSVNNVEILVVPNAVDSEVDGDHRIVEP